MKAQEVPEEQARSVRCPACAARRDYPCRSTSLSGRGRAKKRACMGRRRAWLARNEEMSGD